MTKQQPNVSHVANVNAPQGSKQVADSLKDNNPTLD
jgi:hypothetical protein